ncbi:putative RNA-directed DNA polymerase from transposon BS [Trichonephila clavipes]|nr:putative RNA-directed DNA polymerase from transposon BS [Trichonephila clavipes]
MRCTANITKNCSLKAIDVACHRYTLNMQVSSGTKNNSSPNEPSCTTVTVSFNGVLLVPIIIWRLEVTGILKYLSGRDWFSEASTLRITYIALVRPVLEYGHQIFQVASPTNLKKLEIVQLSAARIITGLGYSCPTDIVLYEADIQPLTMSFGVNSYRYFNKIKSFGAFNRTSSFILNWTSNQRLKRDSPLNYVCKRGFIDFNVDPSTPFSCITPIDSFNHVEFREELLTSTPKHSSHPELLRQLVLEVINDIPDQALIIYTDSRAGSGIFSNTPGNDVKISIRNPDHCSVFSSELIAISGALEHALNSYKDNISIFSAEATSNI